MLSLILSLAAFLAQDTGAPPEQPEPAVVVDAAASDGARAVREVRELSTSLAADTQALRAIAADLEAVMEQLAAPLPPHPLSLAEMDFDELDRVRPEIERANLYLEAWNARAAARERAVALVEAGRAIAETLPRSREAFHDALVARRPAIIELERRVSRGEVREADLGLATNDVSQVVRKSAEWLAQRDETLAAARELLSGFAEDAAAVDALPAPDEGAVRDARRIELALTTIGEAVASEAELIDRLRVAPLETVPAELERLWQEWEGRRASVQTAAETFAAAREEVVALREERAATEAPRSSDVPDGDELFEVRRARRDVEYSRALIAWFERVRGLEARLEASRVALAAASKEASKRHAAFSRQSARVLSASALYRERTTEELGAPRALPESVEPHEVWNDWRAAQDREADRRAFVEEVTASGADHVTDERLESERDALRLAEQRLASELSHAEFVAGMASRDDAELVRLLTPGEGIEAELARLDDEIVALNALLDDASARCVEVAEEVREVESPHSRKIMGNRPNRSEEILAAIEQLEDGEVLPDLSEGGLDVRPEDVLGDEARRSLTDPPHGEPLEVARWEQDRLESQQVFTRLLLSYYTQLGAARDRLAEVAEERRALGEQREALATARMQQIKMRYAAANELAGRVARGESSIDAPEGLAEWTSSDLVARAGEDLRDLRDEGDEFLARVDYLQERLATVAILSPIVQSVCDSADARASIIGTPVSRMTSALTPVEELDTVAVKNLKFEADSRRAEEEGVVQRLWKRFSSEDVLQRYEEPLAAYYLELANTDRVLNELTEAERAYGTIAETWHEDRSRLLPARESSKAVEAQREFDYQAARYAASVARFPDARKRIEQAFRTAFGRDLPYRLEVDLDEVRESADALASAEMRFTAQLALRQNLERLLSKSGIELEVSWYREQVSRVRAMLERAKNDRARLRRSIDDLRGRYRERLKHNAVIGVVITLCIPLLAWIIVALVRRFAKRFEYDVVGELGEHASDRKRRLRTLARTITAAITVFVWALAAVYVFAQLGLDITPLIASASVVGLAVAFGAQALIKDFFYGFFILLENQFTVGDVVQLGSISGTVEKISLRITILRDLKGVVHYIPNGSIGQVSNMTQGWARVVLEVSVPYREDPDRATRILEDVLAELYADEAWQPFILEPPVVAGVQNLTERSIDIRLMIKTRPGRQWEVAREARRRIKQRLDREGIESPFPHRVIHHVHRGPADEDAIGEAESDDLGA